MSFRPFFLLAFLFVSLAGMAQPGYQAVSASPADSTRETSSGQPGAQRLRVGLELGTGVSTNFRGGASFNTFVSPYLSYRLSPRWTVNAGATVMNGSFGGYYGGDARYAAAPTQRTFVFAQAQYQATEKLWIMGTSYYETSRWAGPMMNQAGFADGRGYSFNSRGGAIYAEYKVSEHFSVGVGAQYSNGNSPYYNGFGGSRFGQPGFGSGFQPGFGPYRNGPMGW